MSDPLYVVHPHYVPKQDVSLRCAFCHGPILIVKEGRSWNHAAPNVDHTAMPEPKGKTGEAVRVRLGAVRASIAQDYLKVLDKKLEWVGPHELTGSENFVLVVSVLAADAGEAIRLGAENGMDTLGKLQRSPATKRQPEEELERPSERAMRETDGGRVSRSTLKMDDWWKCPNCKRRLKHGAEKHYAKYVKCGEAAKVA